MPYNTADVQVILNTFSAADVIIRHQVVACIALIAPRSGISPSRAVFRAAPSLDGLGSIQSEELLGRVCGNGLLALPNRN